MRYLVAGLVVFFVLVLIFLFWLLNEEKWRQKRWDDAHPKERESRDGKGMKRK